jgi:hypothetical protein
MPTSYGYMAGYSNGAGGLYNTAIGKYALLANLNGMGNTAVGHSSLKLNSSGYYNTAVGYVALPANKTGVDNTAFGAFALWENIRGSNNTVCGAGAMEHDTSGSNNTALGQLAMYKNISGDLNTAIGFQTMIFNVTGTNNTVIGAYSGTSTDGLTNATAIGYNTLVNASNKVRIGNSAVTVIEGQVPFTTPSDGRYKYQVREDVKGLDFITRLRPVTYQFDVRRFDAQQAGNAGSPDVQWTDYNEATLLRRSGFIAQEVEKAANASGYNFSGISKPKSPQDHYGLSYESFVVPLVKAVQELSAQVVELQRQVEALKQAAASK